MSADPSRLATLFERIGDAAQRGDQPDVLRLADSARRYAPNHPTACLVYGRALLHAGRSAEAWEFLAGRKDVESALLRAEAALAIGKFEEAVRTCRFLLHDHALETVPGLDGLARRICQTDPARFPGWVAIDRDLCVSGELMGTTVATIDWSESISQPLAASADSTFRVKIPAHARGLILVRAAGKDLLGSSLAWPTVSDVQGWAVLDRHRVFGEFTCRWDPKAVVTVRVTHADNEEQHVIGALTSRPGSDPSQARIFSAPLDAIPAIGTLRVELDLPDGRIAPLLGSPIQLPQPRPQSLTARVSRAPAIAGDTRPGIDVVIPVYKGLVETSRCLESVFAGTLASVSIVVVDDASPEPELRAALEQYERDGRITLITNERNLGFPGAVNRGMRLHPDRDVVLLNSDAVVSPGWLERMQAQAYRDADIGTVTPLGEEASIVSYGRGRAGELAHVLDRMAAEVNAGIAIEIPVGVGFCLYVKRQCLDETGEFDEVAFAKGYGEENDFCLRARGRGWRHVAAADVFVAHLGGRSFGAQKRLLMQRNRHVINYRYPGYDALVAEFNADDPLLPAKRALDVRRLMGRMRNAVLLVTLDASGGVKRHVQERRTALETSGHMVLELRPELPAEPHAPARRLRLFTADLEHLRYRWPLDQAQLRSLLLDLGLVGMEIHHFLGLPAEVLEQLGGLGVPYQVVLHDYSWVCPQLSFVTSDNKYCGQPALEACEACTQRHGSKLRESTSVASLRARSERLLRGAERVIAPSVDVRSRFARYFKDLAIEVAPWERAGRPPLKAATPLVSERIRVLLLGALGPQKGFTVLLDCARDAAARDLPLEFVVVGFTSDDDKALATGRVFITGPYGDQEIGDLIGRERCHLAWFPTVGPETWCYTLTHALGHGLPVVAFDIGAVAERLRDANTGELLPCEIGSAEINDRLLQIGRSAIRGNPEGMQEKSVAPVDDSEQDAQGLSATVQVLDLPPGLYVFTVERGGGPTSQSLMLPALQVAPAPMRAAGRVEFLGGPSTVDRWLTQTGDAITVKVSGADARLMLTSVRSAESGALSIDVRRLDAPSVSEPPPAVSISAPSPGPSDSRILTLIHVPYLGDLTFKDGWAGKPSENLWIEAFSFRLEQPDLPQVIEYRGVTEEGAETGWVSGGEICGERGTGVPMVGFAVRLNQNASRNYRYSYSGRFLSGNVLGPYDDGRLCRSDAPGDPLVAVELHIAPLPGTAAAPTAT